MKTFLLAVFITAITLCGAAAITGLTLLYNLGAVIALAAFTAAITTRWLHDLQKEDTK